MSGIQSLSCVFLQGALVLPLALLSVANRACLLCSLTHCIAAANLGGHLILLSPLKCWDVLDNTLTNILFQVLFKVPNLTSSIIPSVLGLQCFQSYTFSSGLSWPLTVLVSVAFLDPFLSPKLVSLKLHCQVQLTVQVQATSGTELLCVDSEKENPF